jgi:hypothetical protein
VGIGKQPRFNWQTPESIRSLEPNDWTNRKRDKRKA